MTKDEIRQALHLLAMGRMHPLHDQLAEALAQALARDLPPPVMTDEEILNERVTPEEVAKAVEHLASLPKRRKKAD